MITVGLYGIANPSASPHPSTTHDHSIAIMRKGRVETVVQLERWTGRKHDDRLPGFITELLDALLPAGEPERFVSVDSFAGGALASADGNLRIEPINAPGQPIARKLTFQTTDRCNLRCPHCQIPPQQPAT